jgi:hypothetical protein
MLNARHIVISQLPTNTNLIKPMKTTTSHNMTGIMRFLAILTATLGAMSASSTHAQLVITAGRVDTSPSTSGYFDLSSPDQTYASSGTYASNPVPTNSNTDLANGILPTILSGTLSGGSLTNLTDGPAQTNDNDAGASAWSDSPITFRIDLGSDKAIAQFNSYTWQSGIGRAQQTYTLLAAPASVADASNLALYTTLASVSTFAAPIQFEAPGQIGVSIRDGSGTLGTFRYIAIQDSTSNGSFYGEFDVVAVPEPSTLALLGAGMGLLVLARYRSRK